MASHSASIVTPASGTAWDLAPVAAFPRLRALAWNNDTLYASRGYGLLRATIGAGTIEWQRVAHHRPSWWRNLSCRSRLAFRLVRDGFHALAVLSTGHLIAAVPGAILTLVPGEGRFRVSHKVLRGTRPLHIAVTPEDHAFWGEYFDNPQRNEVHIYASTDHGATWSVAYTFAKAAIRHVHNIVFDRWENCLWVLTGDHGGECRILRASRDFSNVEAVLSGNQQARAVALVPAPEGLYFSSDTPFETNHVYCLDRRGSATELASLSGSSIYGCQVGAALFFSTMVEPSAVNLDRRVHVYGSRDGCNWQSVLQWQKDRWPMHPFQYGNALLPDGSNTSGVLAVSTVAVGHADLATSLWQVNPKGTIG
jgi:hypothetical protein